ncbi:MAG: hypothetical protein J6038_03795 [Bacilli bacterium]|nr:hypothetical protein [Bacilli bacterium]
MKERKLIDQLYELEGKSPDLLKETKGSIQDSLSRIEEEIDRLERDLQTFHRARYRFRSGVERG